MNDRVLDIVMEWEERVQEGRAVSVEELCRDDPDLVKDVRIHIKAMIGTLWLERFATRHGDGDAPDGDAVLAKLPDRFGRYEVRGLIGIGGFGYVLRGHDPELHRDVAIKVPRAQKLRSSAEGEQFLQEARHLASLKHSGIVGVYDVGRHGDTYYIVTELIEGESLSEKLALEAPDWRSACRTVARIAEVLDYAHAQGFIHRDIKPGNILLDGSGNAHLADFGIAIRGDDGTHKSTRNAGTRAYMAPEQRLGQPIDGRCDLFSLGVVFYQMIVGRLPTPTSAQELSKSIAASAPHIPPGLSTIISRLLEPAPEARFQRAKDVAAELSRFLNGAVASGEAGDGRRWRRIFNGPFIWWAVAAVSSVVLALVLIESTGLTGVFPRPGSPPGPAAAVTPPPLLPVTGPRPAPMPVMVGPGSEEVFREFWAKYYRVPVTFTNDIGMRFILVPPGSYHMGLPRKEEVAIQFRGPTYGLSREELQHIKANEMPVHGVTITEPFYISVHEVTQDQFEAVMGRNPSFSAESGGGRDRLVNLDTRHQPVENVTWHDAATFCERLGRSVEWADADGGGAGDIFRLPTEAQWEYACRAGVLDAWWEEADKTGREFFADSGAPHPQQVGVLQPNRFGLYDIRGNVAEWVRDRFGPYSGEDATDPAGPDAGAQRVVRGGAFDSKSIDLRESIRRPFPPDHASPSIGFRVAVPVQAVRQTHGERGERPTDPDRELAERLLSAGHAPVRIRTNHRNEHYSVENVSQLPEQVFFTEGAYLRNISDEDVAVLAPAMERCRRLRHLTLNCREGATAGALTFLSGLEDLTVLHLVGLEKSTAEQSNALASLRSVRVLRLLDCKIDIAFVRSISKSPGLHDLSLTRCPVHDQAISELAALTSLESLQIESPLLTDDGVRFMPQIGTLQTLEVASPNITDGVWPHIAEMLNLREVHLRSPQVTGRGIGALTKLPRLRSLCLEAAQVDIESLRSLESMPGLRVLELRTPSFGDADVHRLGGFQQLRRIELEATPVTATGAAELKRLLPDCMIVFTENGEKQVLN